MLELSTKSRYGLRAMIDLAIGFGNGPVLMGDISKNQEISRKYLHSILTSLKTAGLIKSIRGAKGGYVLTRPPNEIKLSHILEAVEGKLSLVNCVSDITACNRFNDCKARKVWKDLNDSIYKLVDATILSDLLDH